MLKTFGVLPCEERAAAMLERDYLWCALHLMLDDEEELARLCPTCRTQAQEGRCPACGEPTGLWEESHNAAFDPERFAALSRGVRP